jgi:hypothetical protein
VKDRDEQEHLGLVHQRMQVEVDAALDEKDRDEEPESGCLELAGDLFRVVAPDEQADDDAGGEGPQQHVQAQLDGQVRKKDHERDRDADGELG